MQSLTFFNIGFRSDNIYESLKGYNEEKRINKTIVEDSKKIINDCLRFDKDIASIYGLHNNYEVSDLLSFIYYFYETQSIKNIANELNDILKIIQDIINDEPNVDTRKAKEFFQNLSEYCLAKNNSQKELTFDII
jgi:hypothetical protein